MAVSILGQPGDESRRTANGSVLLRFYMLGTNTQAPKLGAIFSCIRLGDYLSTGFIRRFESSSSLSTARKGGISQQ